MSLYECVDTMYNIVTKYTMMIGNIIIPDCNLQQCSLFTGNTKKHARLRFVDCWEIYNQKNLIPQWELY